MNTLARDIETLKNDIGKPRATRGLKVRDAAIRFQEKFLGQTFSTKEFNEWIAGEPALTSFNGTTARARLQAVGYRDDMPRSFEIRRTQKSSWTVLPIEEVVPSRDVPEAILMEIKKQEKRLQKRLQAIDLDSQDRFSQFSIVQFIREFRRCKQQTLISFGGMIEITDQLNSKEYLALSNTVQALQ